MMSAPARTYSACTSATRSGCVRFSASKLLLMKTPFAYSIVPIAPSQTSTRSRIASRNGISMRVEVPGGSEIDPLARHRLRVYQQVRVRDEVEPDRSHAFAHR